MRQVEVETDATAIMGASWPKQGTGQPGLLRVGARENRHKGDCSRQAVACVQHRIVAGQLQVVEATWPDCTNANSASFH